MKRAFGLIVGICLLGAAAVAAEPIELAGGERERLAKAMDALTLKLSLDEMQVESFRPLLAEHYRDLSEIREVYSRWPAEEGRPAFLQEREELRVALYQKLGSVLDPTQLDRFKRLQAANVNHAAAAREPE